MKLDTLMYHAEEFTETKNTRLQTASGKKDFLMVSVPITLMMGPLTMKLGALM